MRLKNKNIIRAGASGFLGQEIAKSCFENGANCILIDKDKSKLKKIFSKKLKKNKLIQCDITKDEDILVLKKLIKGKIIHGVVNLIAKDHKVTKKNDSSFKSFLSVNRKELLQDYNLSIVSVVALFQSLIPNLVKAKKSSIINFSSDLSVIAPNHKIYSSKNKNYISKPISYSLTKHASIGLTKYLSTYYGNQGIRFNSISPGAVKKKQNKKFVNKITNLIPMGRMANKKELNGLVIYLLSDDSTYTTGTNILVDGGRSVW